MLERFTPYLRPPVFPDDEDKTFTASLLHVILWSLLVGLCLYTVFASLLAFISPDMLVTAWLYVLALSALTAALLVIMRRGYVQRAAILINLGLWLILTVAAYFNGGVVAPAYSGYLMVIVCTCLLVSWQWGLAAAVASALAGIVFLLAAANHWLPDWLSTYSLGSVWSANLAYFFIVAMLLTLALRAIKRAAQKTRLEMAERLKAEQALNNSEQRFRAIFDSVNDAIFVQEFSNGRILDVNQKMCEMYGYTAEEAQRLTIDDLSAGTAPYRQQDVIGRWQKTAGGEPQIFEWLAKDRQNRLFWVEVNMQRAVIDGQDRLLVVVRDVDERKRTEAALRREQAYYEAIVNATPVMLWLKDTENRLLHLNPAAAKFEGVDVADVEGKSCYELYPREQAEAYFQDDLEVIRSGQPQLGIVEEHTAVGTGNMMWVETGKVPVRDEQGTIVGVLACAIDITQRKEAEQIQAATRQVAEAALMTQNLTEFYQAVHAIVSPLIPASNFYITLHDAVNDLFNTPYLFDECDEEWLPYPPGKGLGAYVLRTGEPLLASPEVFAEMEQQGKAEIINRRMVEWLGVPLKTPQGNLGVMAVQNYSGPARLNEKHKDLLVFVSAQVAMAIERKRAEERERRVSQGLRAVIEATQELMDCADLDTLYRRSVELAREKIGVERCGLYVLEDDEKFLRGTFGTDDQGRTTDERPTRDPLEDHPEVFALTDRLWTSYDKLFTYWKDGHAQMLQGTGWNAATPIRSRNRIVGVLYNDAALTRAPLDETVQEVVAVYGSLLGSLIELKRTEADLAHERDLLQALMDNFPDTIYFKDNASRFTRINRAQVRLLGVASPEEAIGKTDADFFQTGELAQQFLREEQRLMTSGEPIIDRVEYNPTPDGSERWLSASKVPLRDASGQIVGMVGISRDISDRMLAERRDKTISRGLRAVIESVHELIGCVDLDTLYRRAVELAREKLDVERCGLFTLDELGWLHGSYGTDRQRRTSDERAAHFAPNILPGLDAAPDQLWTIRETEHAFWEGDAHRVFGAGWVGVTFIRTRDRTVGVLYNDTAITRAPVNEARQEVLAVYCSLLGSLIELKHAERERTESELLFRRAISAAGAVPYYLDYASESYRFMGEGIQAMTGVLPGDMQPSLWNTLIVEAHPLGQARELSHPEAVRETRAGHLSEWRCDYRVRQPDGVERWITDASIPVVNEQGQPRGAIGILQDITERKQAEVVMQESEALFRQLAENAPALIALTDEHGMATYLNRAWREFRGDVPALLLDEWSAQVHPDDRERYLHEFRSSLQARRNFTIEYRLRRADGAYRWLLDTIVPRYAADEKFAGLIGIAIDMTDRKNTEEALRRSEARLRLLTENMVDTISQIDARYRVLYVSPSIERELGYHPAELLGQHLLGVLHPDDGPIFFHQMIMAAALRAPTLRQVYRQRHAAGHYLWIESEIQLLYDDAGEFSGAVFGSRDVSARQQAEAEREAVIKELEEKNAELERFTYTVSHDLKSPLITIRGFLGFLEKDAATGNLDRLRSDIGRIADATTRMQRLLDELLSLSRVGRLTNTPQEIAFGALAREAVELVQGRIMARGVQVEIAANLPTVYGDYARLVEVLQNLIDNAVKFMGNQLEPRITIGALGTDPQGVPIFFVQDNGVGIDPNYHERIFGLFNKLDAQSEGTGVGLALVKRIIEVHGGHIWVESDGIGHGTMFLFTLPYRPAV